MSQRLLHEGGELDSTWVRNGPENRQSRRRRVASSQPKKQTKLIDDITVDIENDPYFADEFSGYEDIRLAA